MLPPKSLTNKRKNVGLIKYFLLCAIIVLLVLLLYFVVINSGLLVDPYPEFVFNKENIKQASAMCGTTLNNCCGNCHDFTTALVIAEEQKNQMCLDVVADTCTLFRIEGCNTTAMKRGEYGASDDSELKFIELCNMVYNDKIRCKYVDIKYVDAKEGSCAQGYKKVSYDCITDNNTQYMKGECVPILNFGKPSTVETFSFDFDPAFTLTLLIIILGAVFVLFLKKDGFL